MKTNIEAGIIALAKLSIRATDSTDALKFSQAVLNLANARNTIAHTPVKHEFAPDNLHPPQGWGSESGLKIMPDYDDCILGVVERCGQSSFVLYDPVKVIQKLMDRDGMTHEEAAEFLDFNMAGAWMGDRTPGFLLPFPVVEVIPE